MPIDPVVVMETWTTKPLRSCCYGSPGTAGGLWLRGDCGKRVFCSSLHTLTLELLPEESGGFGNLKDDHLEFAVSRWTPPYDQPGPFRQKLSVVIRPPAPWMEPLSAPTLIHFDVNRKDWEASISDLGRRDGQREEGPRSLGTAREGLPRN
uniref:Uncharacterized protein n=2 Tax=Knipowitschia caucasica TaxID=637954 RepID=A0AAV2JBB5_KNICA